MKGVEVNNNERSESIKNHYLRKEQKATKNRKELEKENKEVISRCFCVSFHIITWVSIKNDWAGIQASNTRLEQVMKVAS